MRYAKIDELEYVNGNGVGVSIYTQGCAFHCKDCFNQEAWDFDGGYNWDAEIKDHVLELLKRPYVTRLSVLGGEPLDGKNVRTLYLFLKEIKQQFPTKKIWLYTGYIYENILINNLNQLLHSTQTDEYRQSIVKLCDVLVDGQFETDKKDLTLKFRGSKNQRVIDIQETLKQNKVVLYCD